MTRIVLFWLAISSTLLCSTPSYSERLHILIPGGAGGGWDSTARGVGDALARSGIIETVSYENISGGSGSRAISYLIETAERQENTLMVSSTPIILSSLRGIFPQSFRDLTPVAAVIADYGAFVVRQDSPHQDWQSAVDSFLADPQSVKVAGGSARGSMDHLVAALAIKESGGHPRELRYIPYDAGAQAMVGLLSGETQMLSTGLSEALALAKQGEVRILAMTAPEPLPQLPDIKTLIQHGVQASFINWRGFFAAPGFPLKQQTIYLESLQKMYETRQWEDIRDSRGWSDLFVHGEEFAEFLDQQEEALDRLLIDLGLKPDMGQ